MPKTIEAFKLRTELIVDATKGHAEYTKFEKRPAQLAEANKKAAKESDSAWSGFFKGMSKGQEQFQGGKIGKKFGEEFGTSAVTAITGSIGNIGQTIGALVGSGIAPGIGTAIGSTIGSGIDTALQKVSGPILAQISRGIELNKLLERSRVHFTTFVGDEKEAVAHLEDLKKLSGDTGLRMGVLVEGSQRLEEFTNKLDLSRLIMRAAADQSAKFYGDATVGFDEMSDALGRIVLRGEDVGKLMKKLESQGVHWKQYLAEGLGLTEKQVTALIKAGRIKGTGIATLTAQGIERHAGGFAQMMGTVGPGVEQRADALMEIRAAEGTQKLTGGIGDAYTKFVQILDSPQAKKIVDFIDKMGGYVVNLTESAVTKAVSVGGGIAEGIMNFSPASMMQGFTKLGDTVESGLKSVFEIHSPSERSAREVGVPIGQGIGFGTAQGMMTYAQDHADEDAKRFIAMYAAAAIEAMKRTGVPASVSLAQALVESGVGKSGLTRKANNFFGIKGSGPAGSVVMRTREETKSGQSYYVNAPFRAYNNATESFLDHARFLQGPRYRGALADAGDPKKYAQDIKRAGYATDVSYVQKLSGAIDKYGLARFDVGGKPVDGTNPMPVRVVGDLEGGASDVLRQAAANNRSNAGVGSRFLQNAIGAGVDTEAKGFVYTLDETGRAVTVAAGDFQSFAKALVAVQGPLQALTTTTPMVTEIALRPLRPLIEGTSESARAAFATNADIQKKNRQLYIENASLGQQILGAFQSISGQIPGQQVGKKRSLFSKILGIAAPFLSFIPGVGPILSTIAGIAGNAVGGNYGAAVSGTAGGFQTGGVFRSGGVSVAKEIPHRAFGGPARAGQPYIVGERREELFVPNQNGWIHPSVPSGGGLHPEHVALLDRLHSVLDRLESIRPGDVVAMGAHGLAEGLSRNATATRRTQLALGLK
jgi:hypothetical protein